MSAAQHALEPLEVARTMLNLPQPLPARYAGARFRPCRWSDLYDRTKPDTWGIECKPAGQRRYTPVGWQMQVAPSSTGRVHSPSALP